MDFGVGRTPTALATLVALGTAPALAHAQTAGAASFGPLLLRTLVTLGLVLLLLVVVLRFAARAGIGRRAERPSTSLEVVHRQLVGPRQALLVARFGDRAVLIGQSVGSLERLAEMSWARYAAGADGFGALLERDAPAARAQAPDAPDPNSEASGFNA
jgi:flagellar biogenesis protein FliO